MFVPAGELVAVIDLILLYSVRTIAWVLYEFEAQLELEVAEEAEAEGSDSTWQFMDRLKETAPQRILGGSRSKVTASVLCHYPAGLPTWNPTGRRNSAEHKRVKALALKKLERALGELVSYRRSLVDRLATSRGGDKPPEV